VSLFSKSYFDVSRKNAAKKKKIENIFSSLKKKRKMSKKTLIITFKPYAQLGELRSLQDRKRYIEFLTSNFLPKDIDEWDSHSDGSYSIYVNNITSYYANSIGVKIRNILQYYGTIVEDEIIDYDEN
jgi:hypothetical protein